MTRVLPAIIDALSPPDLHPRPTRGAGPAAKATSRQPTRPDGCTTSHHSARDAMAGRLPRSVVRTIATPTTACHTRRVTRPPWRQRSGDQRRSQQHRLRASPVRGARLVAGRPTTPLAIRRPPHLPRQAAPKAANNRGAMMPVLSAINDAVRPRRAFAPTVRGARSAAGSDQPSARRGRCVDVVSSVFRYGIGVAPRTVG